MYNDNIFYDYKNLKNFVGRLHILEHRVFNPKN